MFYGHERNPPIHCNHYVVSSLSPHSGSTLIIKIVILPPAPKAEIRDTEVTNQAAIRVEVVTTVTEIGRPQAGDVAFSSGESKFKGYNGTAWVDFH